MASDHLSAKWETFFIARSMPAWTTSPRFWPTWRVTLVWLARSMMMRLRQRLRQTWAAMRIAPVPSSAVVIETPALKISPATQCSGSMFEWNRTDSRAR